MYYSNFGNTETYNHYYCAWQDQTNSLLEFIAPMTAINKDGVAATGACTLSYTKYASHGRQLPFFPISTEAEAGT
jgi:hypothetical protein